MNSVQPSQDNHVQKTPTRSQSCRGTGESNPGPSPASGIASIILLKNPIGISSRRLPIHGAIPRHFRALVQTLAWSFLQDKVKFLTTGKDLTLGAQGDNSDVTIQLSAGRTAFLRSHPQVPRAP